VSAVTESFAGFEARRRAAGLDAVLDGAAGAAHWVARRAAR
jgi:hypothetical protein